MTPIVLFTLLAVAAVLLTPDAIYKRAAEDLATVPPAKRRVTRYLSLHGVPEEERAKFIQSLDFAVNSTSFRTLIAHPEIIGEDRLLYRIDLESLGWDREARAARRARLKLLGVDSKDPDDVWEEFVKKDPYWKVTYRYPDGRLARGWLDPFLADRVSRESCSASFILSAHWLLPRLLLEEQQGGFYSALLMLPASERDLYKMLGVDEKLIGRDFQLKVGGGTFGPSIVALHPRHLQLVPNLYGYDEKFLWRTFDFKDEKGDDKNLLKRPGGELKHDGREIIFTIPNGLHAYFLADGAGNQVAVVPQDIAVDMREDNVVPPKRGGDPGIRGVIRDRNVVNAYKCIDCHGPQSGLWPFIDIERQAQLNPEIALIVRSKDKRKLAEKTQNLEDYYSLAETGGIEKRIVRQNDSYSRRVAEVNSLDPAANSIRLVNFINQYTWDLVDRKQGAAEAGVALDEFKELCRRSGSDDLVVLSTGQPIRRARWEDEGFRAVMQANVWPWETRVEVKGGKK